MDNYSPQNIRVMGREECYGFSNTLLRNDIPRESLVNMEIYLHIAKGSKFITPSRLDTSLPNNYSLGTVVKVGYDSNGNAVVITKISDSPDLEKKLQSIEEF